MSLSSTGNIQITRLNKQILHRQKNKSLLPPLSPTNKDEIKLCQCHDIFRSGGTSLEKPEMFTEYKTKLQAAFV